MIIKKEFKCESIHFDLSNPTYKPDKFTNYMIHAIKIKKGETIIDVGTGSGAIAIYASKKGMSSKLPAV